MAANLALKEIQLKLNVPQHVLIHLCEKEVIKPEGTDTKGRGQWRRFSTRNLFEFAVALELRRYQIPVLVVAAIIRLLEAFERSARKSMSDFELPDSITGNNPELVMHIFDGESFVLALESQILLSSDFIKAIETPTKGAKLDRIKKLPTDYRSCLTINLSQLAESVADK